MERNSTKSHNFLLNILIVLCVIGILISSYVIYIYNIDYLKGDKSYNSLRLTRDADVQSNESLISAIDFSTLENQNSDFIGWIGTVGNEIDYPLVKGKDNEFYLNHLFTKEKNKLGSIFIDYRNQSDFSDRNTIIYGHNMKDGSMFSSLINYKNEDYYQTHPSIPIYTPNGNYLVEFFAGIVVDGSYESVRFDFSDENDFIKYVDSLVNLSTFKSEVRVNINDKIVTLVTCSYEYNNARYALYGRLSKLP